MNMLHTLPDGSLQELDARSAQAYADHLHAQLPRVEEREQAGVLRAIHELEFIATPAAHFEPDRFTPVWYVPGWQS